MFCSKCGGDLVPGAAFCSACGAPAEGAVTTLEGRLKRPGIVTLLAVLQFVSGGLWMLAALGIVAAMAGASDTPPGSVPVAAAVCIGGGLLQLTCGIGLWKLRPYGRTMQLVFAWIGLLAIPIGTIISICILIYLFKPGVKILFSGKPAHELTPAEVAQIAAATSGSTAAIVIAVIVVVLVGVAALGIVAAIAIPGLLRARMAGNEAAAIGSLRAVNSAQVSYYATAASGGYATRLSTLAVPCPGSSTPYISEDLSNDPSVRSGYTIAVESAGAGAGPRDCNDMPTELDYYATAVPVTVGTTGNRAFATSAAGTVFFDVSGRAPSRIATLGATARPVQ